jgi:sulfur carrier protein
MKLEVNGEQQEWPEIRTLADLLLCLEMKADAPGIAVARNGAVVPRRDLASVSLEEGDRIEIVRAVQGG